MAKGLRRELRRTVGSAAVETIHEQEQATATLAMSLQGLRNDVVSLARDSAVFKHDMLRNLTAIAEAIAAEGQSRVALAHTLRPWYQRLWDFVTA